MRFALILLAALSLVACSKASPGSNQASTGSDRRVFTSEGLTLVESVDVTDALRQQPMFGCVIVGRVKNTGREPRMFPTTWISYRESAREVGTGSSIVDVHILNPGDQALFKILRAGPDSCGDYAISFRAQKTETRGQRILKLSDVSARVAKNMYWITGTVTASW
jgi:hypothetical protein